MYLATLRTSHFEFLTVADTEEDAVEMMKRAWKNHQKNTGATMSWEFVSGGVETNHSDVAVTFIRTGDTFVNGDLMHSANNTPSQIWVIGDDYSGMYFVVCEDCAKESDTPVNYCDFYGETEETNCHNCKRELAN